MSSIILAQITKNTSNKEVFFVKKYKIIFY